MNSEKPSKPEMHDKSDQAQLSGQGDSNDKYVWNGAKRRKQNPARTTKGESGPDDDDQNNDSGTIAKCESAPFKFFDLPVEIRHDIYDCLLPTEDIPTECYPDWWQFRRCNHTSTPLPFIVPVDHPITMSIWAEARHYTQSHVRFTTCLLKGSLDGNPRRVHVPFRPFRSDIDTMCANFNDWRGVQAWSDLATEHALSTPRTVVVNDLSLPLEIKQAGALHHKQDRLETCWYAPWNLQNLKIVANHGLRDYGDDIITSGARPEQIIMSIMCNLRGGDTGSNPDRYLGIMEPLVGTGEYSAEEYNKYKTISWAIMRGNFPDEQWVRRVFETYQLHYTLREGACGRLQQEGIVEVQDCCKWKPPRPRGERFGWGDWDGNFAKRCADCENNGEVIRGYYPELMGLEDLRTA